MVARGGIVCKTVMVECYTKAMTRSNPVRRFFFENSLSIVLLTLFVIFLVGLSVTGWIEQNNELATHGQPAQGYFAYITSGEFGEAVFENWESEFLQMWALVMLTIVLRQKGSTDSKKLKGKSSVDVPSRYSIIQSRSWKDRRKAIGEFFGAHSLGLALLSIFVVAFVLHAITGVDAYNTEQLQYGLPEVSVWEYIGSSRFWFESFQNWQSEFLAVGVLLLLSVFLFERGSPESKPVGESRDKTGSSD
jgi:hypothetical protein